MSGGGIGWRAWRRRLAVDRVLIVALAVSMLVAAASLAAVPRVFERASVDDVRHTIATAEPERRNIRLSSDTRIGPSVGDPLDGIRDEGDELVDAMPEAVATVIDERRFIVDSPPFRVTSYPDRRPGPFTISFRFRIQDGIEDESTLVDGAAPAPQPPIPELFGSECGGATIESFVPEEDVDCRIIEIPVFDTLVTRQTLMDMLVEVGDLVTLTPNQSDLRWQRAGLGGARLVLRIAGVVELSDVERPYWFADNRLHGARVTENSDYRIVDATGLLVADQYAAFSRTLPLIGFDHSWRLFVDAERFDVALADDVAIGIANADLGDVEVITDLPDLVREFREQRTIVLALLSTVVVGLGAVIAATIAALSRLVALRRRSATELVVARGADRSHLVLDAVRTSSVVIAPAAAVGGVLAAVAFPSTGGGAAARVLVLFAVAVASTLVATLGRGIAREPSRSRRAVVDITVVVAALAAVATVRRRGDVSGDGVAELDVLMAVTPGLVIAAVALVLVRLVPLVGRALAALAERRPGAAAFIGLRQLVARPGAARTATGVTAVAIGVAVFASTIQTSISTARSAASWYDVGGELVVEARQPGAPLPRGVDDVPGVNDRIVARRVTIDRSTARYGPDRAIVDVIAVDASAYARLLAGAPIEQPPLESITGSDGVAGAIVSVAWPRGRGPGVGDELTVGLGLGPTSLVVVASVETFPAVPVGRPFIVIDIEAAGVDIRPNALVLADRELAGRLGDVPLTRVEDRQDVLDDLGTDPLGRWTVRVLAGVAVLSGLFAAVAAVTSVAISVRARERDLAVLRTLGLRVRDGSTMTAVEQFPALVVASIGGVVAGAASAWLLRTALGLARFAGPGRPVDIRTDRGATLFTAGLVALAMALTVVIAIRIQRRHDLAATLRVGDTT